MWKRIAVIGDVHTQDEMLELTFDFLDRVNDFEAFLCVGDIVTGPGNAGRCCDILAARNARVVRGNHDRWFLTGGAMGAYANLPRATRSDSLTAAQHQFLAGLPVTDCGTTPRGCVLMSHGLLENDQFTIYPNESDESLLSVPLVNRVMRETTYRYIIGGHTHERMVRTLTAYGKTVTFINPGCLRCDKQPGFATLDFEVGAAQFYDIDPDTLSVSRSQMFAL